MRPLVLASGSPRRRLLLAATGYEFEVIPANVDEDQLPGEAADDMVLRLARAKAHAVAGRVASTSCVLAVDTTVLIDGEILGKPFDDEDAHAMLRRLSGRTHEVVSGYAAVVTESPLEESGVVVTAVTMRALSDDDIAEYVATGEPHDKAGAYAFQGRGRQLVDRVDGLKSNIVGLPLEPIVTALAALGIERSSRPRS